VVHESSTASPREVRRAEASERILDTAEAILGAEGMAALTMQRLATELGYTVGATYRYYSSKDAIVAALQRRVLLALADDLTRSLDASIDDPLVRVAVVARIYATLGTRRPLHARLLARMMGDPENVLEPVHALPNMALAVEVGTAAVRELAAARMARVLSTGDDVERGLVLWASISGVSQTRKLERWNIPGLRTDAIADSLVHALLVGWGADAKHVKRALARADRLITKMEEAR
jgi:AcrR family transcriptional regulator